MKIANPIYDVVFKYLLEDNKIAKLLISNLLDVKIKKLEFRPQEFSKNFKERTLTVYRVDFKAEIVLQSGKSLVVLIEIQKAKFTADIIRFRKYLGEQYANKNNLIEIDNKLVAIPIISIYFLGYGLKHNKDVPIIKVKRQYLDSFNDKLLTKKEDFIESLTHDSVIVQIPALKDKSRNDLEKALSVFEQGKHQEVSINEDDYPPKYKEVIRRLLKAVADEEIRKTMEIEDEILDDMMRKERFMEKQSKALEKKDEEIEKIKEKKDEALKKKDEEIEKLKEKKDEALKKKDEEIEKLKKLLKNK